MEDDIITTTKYSKTKATSYEKRLIKILSEDHNNDNTQLKKKRKSSSNNNNLNSKLLEDVAFEMSNISSDDVLITKYIKKKLRYIIKNTIHNSVDKMAIIPNYEKKNLNSKIGLKLSILDQKILEEIMGKKIEKKNSKKFYEMVLKYNNDNNEKKRKFCVHLSTPTF